MAPSEPAAIRSCEQAPWRSGTDISVISPLVVIRPIPNVRVNLAAVVSND